ncbi:2TM domain-containing protein [Arsenicibacter rosenii]|uniref:2TM domain-containing protein n=1 Tax=Arsenicibacter rosenii TaxID=1750698 RepID=A0A1S2VFV8_9BACT|nr:2TM domain-containing protein [Arsenicibacter rosenii]OIN57589.1 hypothetical protein BLX24_19105 [Arsenicibacter rosenii]
METQSTNLSHDPYIWRQAKARVGFKMHLRTYVIVLAGLWAIWLVTSLFFNKSGFIYPWPIWATLGWGIGLASHYFSVYHGGDEKSMIEREYDRLSQRQ